ncbi:MAG: hypothetical protein QOE61_2966 [Micromonosporaceae bacterium]|nr:hypothetical protein [Micromonosporaceae bacterium]
MTLPGREGGLGTARVLTLDLAEVLSPSVLADEVAGDAVMLILDGTDEDWLRLSRPDWQPYVDCMAALPALTVGVARGDRADVSAALEGPLGQCDLRVRVGGAPPAGWNLVGPPTVVTERVRGWQAAFAEPRAVAAVTAARLVRQQPASAAQAVFLESLAYSTLQSGSDYGAWLRGRSVPTGADDPSPRIAVARRGDVVDVRLTRPTRHNALDARMRDELCEVLGALLVDDRVRIVLTGEGASFCSGGDLAEFGRAATPLAGHLVRSTRSLATLMARWGPRLTVGVQGACVGAGLELAAFAHRVVASSDARFWLPEAGFGLIPGSGGTVSVPRRAGAHRLVELVLTGAECDAWTARDLGLVDEVVAPSQLAEALASTA